MTLFERNPLLYVVGDIHGCKTELVEMLAWIDLHIKGGDKVVFVGDYVDRGPDSKGVLDVIIDRQKNNPHPTIALCGNHEELMMTGDYWLLNGGDTTLASYGFDPYEHQIAGTFFKYHMPDEHRQFVKSLPYYYVQDRICVVHANIDPKFPLEHQTHGNQTFVWARQFDTYDGDYADGYTVIRGHTPVGAVKEWRNQILIDTGCVFGNKLTCCVIDPITLERAYHQVKSNTSY